MNITYSKSAVKFFKKHEKLTQFRIISAIEKIPDGNIVKLHGVSGYRLRVGDYRIIYDISSNVVNIIDIDNRG